MSALPESRYKVDAPELTERITRTPFAASSKIYVQGSRADLRVPMREIRLADTPAVFGVEKNPPFAVYDTSGPYTDPQVSIDLARGLPALRSPWIAERGDTERLPAFCSQSPPAFCQTHGPQSPSCCLPRRPHAA